MTAINVLSNTYAALIANLLLVTRKDLWEFTEITKVPTVR